MSKTVNLGGDRLGSGNKMDVKLHGYNRSTHDMSYTFRSTTAAGTLVPFLNEVILPGDTFDIELYLDIMTHPTLGPLFGSFKAQLDVFEAPVRLYNGILHTNELGIGNHMDKVKLPLYTLLAELMAEGNTTDQMNNSQINPSCLLAYLGVRGVGTNNTSEAGIERDFNAVPLLMYWDVVKNYYANKQEEIGAVIHTTRTPAPNNVTAIDLMQGSTPLAIPGAPNEVSYIIAPSPVNTTSIRFTISAGAHPNMDDWQFKIANVWYTLNEITANVTLASSTISYYAIKPQYWFKSMQSRKPTSGSDAIVITPEVVTFPLGNLDTMRRYLLAQTTTLAPIYLNDANSGTLYPYSYLWEKQGDFPNMMSTQEGLAVKTYQSDMFNNWLQTEWIDGADGITAVTAIDTSGGSFTIDTLNLSNKVYQMLTRTAVSGGSYGDYIDVNYMTNAYLKCETPVYHGSLIRELVFQEIVSTGNQTAEGSPLGTLAGKGTLKHGQKGGHIRIKGREHGYVMGIFSLTPRIDYSQGNKWDTGLRTLADFHVPALDEIGFQELITEKMAWWTTVNVAGDWVQKSAGKQPAWLDYMTNINRTYGNFAIENNEMFMTLNRKYEWNETTKDIDDLTTYIHPAKYNFIYADTSLDAMNYWVQIGVKLTARRVMSAKVMPNL